MKEKEFRRLSRAQLIDIIYQFQIKHEELTAEKERLSKALADKRLRMSNVGNIAEASLEMHKVMQAAQNAAEQYLEEIRIMREETELECQRLLDEAREEADAIIARAQKANPSYDSTLEAILREFGKKQKSTGDRK